MSELTKSDSARSTNSTQSLDSFDLSSTVYSFAPHDLFYDDPESGVCLLVLRQGDPLPVRETKYKLKKDWTYALKFRF